MRRAFVALFLASFASALVAQVDSGSARHYFPANNAAGLFLTGSVEGHGDEILAGSNLNYHSGGSVILSAKAVFIFWGPSFASGGADNGYATTLQAFRNQFYQNLGSGNQFIQLTNLGSD